MNLKDFNAQQKGPSSHLYWVLVVLLALIAALTRTLYLNEWPIAIHNDESACAIHCVPPFLGSNPDAALWGFSRVGGHSNLGPWLSSLAVKLLGENTLWASRIAAATSGTISIILFTLFVLYGFGARTSLFFLVCVIPFHLHLHYSRTGFTYIHAVLFTAIVSLAFVRFARIPSKLNAFVIGAVLGLSVMVYSATQVLPGAVFIGTMAIFLSPTFRERYPKKRIISAFVLSSVAVLGLLTTLGAQLIYIYENGFSSRLKSQFLLNPDIVRHLQLGEQASNLELFWYNFRQTLKFFYWQDGAGQYGFFGAPLEWCSGGLAIIGLCVLIWKGWLRDPIALFLLTMAALIIIGSTLVVEANFSPHLIAFSLLIPLGCALGWEAILKAVRLNSVVLVTVITAILVVVWAEWNWRYYSETTRRKVTRDMWILRLPIAQETVRQIINLSSEHAAFGESYYQLIYPQSERIAVIPSDPMRQLSELLAAKSCPCLAIIDQANAEAVANSLRGAGRGFEEHTRELGKETVFFIQ